MLRSSLPSSIGKGASASPSMGKQVGISTAPPTSFEPASPSYASGGGGRSTIMASPSAVGSPIRSSHIHSASDHAEASASVATAHPPAGGGLLSKITVYDVPLRSATERRIVDNILTSEGQWDEQAQVFFTKERVLQERTHCITRMHQTLRFSPESAYDTTGKDSTGAHPVRVLASASLARNAIASASAPKTTGGSMGASAAASGSANPAVLSTSYRGASSLPSGSGLDNADPHPENVERRRLMAEGRKKDAVAIGKERNSDTSALQSLEQELVLAAEHAIAERSASAAAASMTPTSAPYYSHQRQTAATQHRPSHAIGGGAYDALLTPSSTTKRPGTMLASRASPSGEYSLLTPSLSENTALSPLPAAPPSFPQITWDATNSSLLMQLRKTRKEIERASKEQSTLKTILNLDAPPDLKRTITKMFADPKNAEKISQEEHERRAQRFEEEKRVQLAHQTALLAEERHIMEREMAGALSAATAIQPPSGTRLPLA